MESSSPSCNELAGRSNLASIADSPRYCYKLNNTRFAEFQHLPCEDYYVVSTLSSHPGGYKLCYIFDGGNCRPSEWIHCADAPPAQPMPAPFPPPLLPSPTPLPPARSPSTLQLPPSPPATPISSSALAPSPQVSASLHPPCTHPVLDHTLAAARSNEEQPNSSPVSTSPDTSPTGNHHGGGRGHGSNGRGASQAGPPKCVNHVSVGGRGSSEWRVRQGLHCCHLWRARHGALRCVHRHHRLRSSAPGHLEASPRA